ncbi:MAG: hypothetical protein ACOCP4_01935 [Candidatus Woesearchaeota archaeon]
MFKYILTLPKRIINFIFTIIFFILGAFVANFLMHEDFIEYSEREFDNYKNNVKKYKGKKWIWDK